MAETTLEAALSLGADADHAEIVARAHEIRAWINLTAGGYHGRSLQRELASKPSHAMPSGFSSPPRKPRPKRGWRTAANRSFPGQGRSLQDSMCP